MVEESAKPKGKPKKEKAADARPELKKPDPAQKPDTPSETDGFHVVKAGTFEQKVKIPGIIESTVAAPIEMDLMRWADMTVIKVVPHGTAVKKGDVLIELDPKDLKKKIDDMKVEMPLKELELSAAERELEKAEKTTPLALERASREKMQAEEDLAHFEDQTRPMRDRAAKEEVKEAVESLSYAEEELKQLKKMYEQDDLTEETEEIILRRTENSVARLRWNLEQVEARSARVLDTLLPREHESLKSDFELKEISWRAGERSMREALEKTRLETALGRRQLEELRKSLAEHERDLAAMKVASPQDGIVFYGMSQRGKWTTASQVEKKLIPGGKLAMREIVMTVVDPSSVHLKLQLSEDQLKDLAVGQVGTVQLKWAPDFKFNAKVTAVSHVPYADRTFDGIVGFEMAEDGPKLFPGMSAVAEIRLYEKENAIAIPVSAVKKEGEKETVTLKGGRSTLVKTGRRSGDEIEILEGLKPGDVIGTGSEKKEGEAEETADKKKPDGKETEGEAESGKEEAPERE